MYKLTPREIQVRDLIKQGYTNKDISLLLKISENTVKAIVHNLFEKIGCASRVELAIMTEVQTTTSIKNRIKVLKIQEAHLKAQLQGISDELLILAED